ncbi:hypothetical protein [Streptomyces puniciscabiei]
MEAAPGGRTAGHERNCPDFTEDFRTLIAETPGGHRTIHVRGKF